MKTTAMMNLNNYYELGLSLYLESEETLIAVCASTKAVMHTDHSGKSFI